MWVHTLDVEVTPSREPAAQRGREGSRLLSLGSGPFKPVKTILCNRGEAAASPGPLLEQAGSRVQDVSGEQKPQLRISALVSCLLQAAGTPRFHPAKTLGGSRAPSSRVWALGWAAQVQTLPSPGHLSLGQDSCPPRASALSAVPRGHGRTLAELTCYRPWGAWWLQGRR